MFNRNFSMMLLLACSLKVNASMVVSGPSLDEIYDRYRGTLSARHYEDAARLAIEIARNDKSGFFVNDIYEDDRELAKHLQDQRYPPELLLKELSQYLAERNSK